MDLRSRTALARRLGLSGSRRTILAALLGAVGVVRDVPTTEARRTRKKRRKPTSCAKQCGERCSTCYERASGAVLCGGVGSADCAQPCRSDNDCLGTERPFCTTGFTDRATGEKATWGCAAACTNVAACEAPQG
jgi:hypothetical protein